VAIFGNLISMLRIHTVKVEHRMLYGYERRMPEKAKERLDYKQMFVLFDTSIT